MKNIEILDEQRMEDIMGDDQLQFDSVFVIEPGYHIYLQNCAQSGYPVIAPNLFMSPELILQTILRMNKNVVVTTRAIWNRIKTAFYAFKELLNDVKLMIIQG